MLEELLRDLRGDEGGARRALLSEDSRDADLMARLEKAGVSASLIELLTTPLAHQRRRLNGSGLVLVRPPDGVLAALGAAATAIGERCATRPGAWSMRVVSW